MSKTKGTELIIFITWVPPVAYGGMEYWKVNFMWEGEVKRASASAACLDLHVNVHSYSPVGYLLLVLILHCSEDSQPSSAALR